MRDQKLKLMKARLINLCMFISLAAFCAASIVTRPFEEVDSHEGTIRPLTSKELASATGAGSTCRLGCNEPDTPCHGGFIGGGWESEKQIWYPHNECAYATGSDTCIKGKDTDCTIIYMYSDENCLTEVGRDVTTSSTCKPMANPVDL